MTRSACATRSLCSISVPPQKGRKAGSQYGGPRKQRVIAGLRQPIQSTGRIRRKCRAYLSTCPHGGLVFHTFKAQEAEVYGSHRRIIRDVRCAWANNSATCFQTSTLPRGGVEAGATLVGKPKAVTAGRCAWGLIARLHRAFCSRFMKLDAGMPVISCSLTATGSEAVCLLFAMRDRLAGVTRTWPASHARDFPFRPSHSSSMTMGVTPGVTR